jgi:tight adherence protein B
MMASVPSTAVALAVCLLLALALVAGSRAVAGGSGAAAPQGSTPSMLAGLGGGRVAVSVAVCFVVLMLTRWVLLAVFAGGMVLLWGRLLHDDRADAERARVEGIAKWLEDLRDTLRGSSMGAEEALEQVATRPPEAIAGPLRHYLHRRRQGFRTEDALADLADDLAHPTSDAAIAALCLVVGGSTSAGRLYGTVQALASAARDEVTARERIDRTRAIYQTSMQRLVIIGALLVGYLRFAGGDLLQPYDTAVGQLVLLVPLGMWLGCVLWLRSLCGYELPRRSRLEHAS